MRSVDRGHTIAFLLSIGALPLGCPAEDDGESDSNATTPTTTTAGSTGSTTTAGTEATDSDASMSSTASTTSATTPSSTASTTVSTDATDVSVGTDPDTGYGTYGSSGGVDPCLRLDLPEVCADVAMNYANCYPRLPAYYAEELGLHCGCLLVYYAPMYGPNCASAYEELYACLNLLACGESSFDSCPAEQAAVDESCGSSESTGSGE